MAEVNTGDGGKKGKGKSHTKKVSTKIDMTPMVDLAFLLITFFMLTTTLTKQHKMDLPLPFKDESENKEHEDIPESRTITFLLDGKNKIGWYQTQGGKAIKLNETNYSDEGLRKILFERKKEHENFIVVVKATDDASYKNIVDMMDEIRIVNCHYYQLADISNEDLTLLGKPAQN